MHRNRLRNQGLVRRAVQFSALLATNLHLSGWVDGTIYTGGSKAFFIPGLHCYSCPSSILACPLGSLQSLLAAPNFWGMLATGRPDALVVLSVIGFIAFLGFLAGRFACGWICPFGLLQDLLYRIPSPKFGFQDSLRPAKYALLFILVLALPAFLRPVAGGAGDPWFCKIVCPAGTSLAGWPLVSASPADFQLGFLFWWKSSIAILILLWAVTVERPFCRSLCPLGAAWGLMGRVSLFRMRVAESCISCGKCQNVCPMGIAIYREPGSSECIRCGKCAAICPVGAISHTVSSGEKP
ncbi:MAG TPA: 4Fe-4S binding protein [Candidatus Sabulitectum sp.]|nr:4Fe-4S binding protein [Candidatus Sabulitectum sp.]